VFICRSVVYQFRAVVIENLVHPFQVPDIGNGNHYVAAWKLFLDFQLDFMHGRLRLIAKYEHLGFVTQYLPDNFRTDRTSGPCNQNTLTAKVIAYFVVIDLDWRSLQ